MAAVAARPNFPKEDWLYLVTTDHGGIARNHGGQTPEERTIFLIASGGAYAKGKVSAQKPGHVVIPALVTKYLGLTIDPE